VSRLVVNAYAKINLGLSILGRRDDGFHELESIAVGLDWYDRLTAAPLPGGIEFRCSAAGLAGPENLAWRAAALIQNRFHVGRGIRLELEKRLDVGAGLGGGSSDAAAALLLCNALWGLELSRSELAALGAELGSDVPLFFHLPHVWMAGRGDRVRPVSLAWRGWVVLVRTGVTVSTAAAYRRWRREDACKDTARRLNMILNTADAGSLEQSTFNDLQKAVFRVAPRIGQLRRRLRDVGIERPLRVTGAGSVMVLLEDSESAAVVTAARVLETGLVPDVSVVRVLDTETLDVTEE